MTDEYKDGFGKSFRFGDAVRVTCTLLPPSETVGRLIQVRKGVGQYGTDVYLIRKPDGRLSSFANVGLFPADVDLPRDAEDSTDVSYTISGGYPEIGFVIESPKQPQSESPLFAVCVVDKAADPENVK